MSAGAHLAGSEAAPAGATFSAAQAYRVCEAQTRAAAANFYYGIRLLPRDKRRAMCAVYAFARDVDDIGDGALPPDEKLRRLDLARVALGELRAGAASGSNPVMVALADAYVRFALPLDALEDLIEGVRMDVVGTNYESFEELLLYCRRVAGSIGRLCLAIFGSRDPRAAAQLADDLGVAMQLTNIVRDLREDAQRGRVYLPAQELVRYHLHDSGALGEKALLALMREGSSAEPAVIAGFDGGDVGQLYALMRFQVLRSRDWFHRGMPLLLLLDRRSAACVMAMTGIYQRLLKRIEQRPDCALAQRTALSMREKALVVARALLGRRRIPEQHPAERML
ncbi:MAG TPA: squalene/phytoene synthase family protein [Solirubrobacteraceae bacterium]|jgi:phytoene synthase|nr:squalene/phytoene synthase family protein [Solirubrobacteraceae bacterium]